MIHTFDYWQIRDKWYPMIPIVVKDIETAALIDSGASVSLFRPDLAYDLGIEIETGDKIILEGVGGRIVAYLHEVPVSIESYNFNCKIGFSVEYTASLNLIGRDNFFEHFLISFNESNRKLMLELAKGGEEWSER